MEQELIVWVVEINSPKGWGEIEVPSFMGAEVAGRRGRMAAVLAGWGDLPEIQVLSVRQD